MALVMTDTHDNDQVPAAPVVQIADARQRREGDRADAAPPADRAGTQPRSAVEASAAYTRDIADMFILPDQCNEVSPDEVVERDTPSGDRTSSLSKDDEFVCDTEVALGGQNAAASDHPRTADEILEAISQHNERTRPRRQKASPRGSADLTSSAPRKRRRMATESPVAASRASDEIHDPAAEPQSYEKTKAPRVKQKKSPNVKRVREPVGKENASWRRPLLLVGSSFAAVILGEVAVLAVAGGANPARRAHHTSVVKKSTAPVVRTVTEPGVTVTTPTSARTQHREPAVRHTSTTTTARTSAAAAHYTAPVTSAPTVSTQRTTSTATKTTAATTTTSKTYTGNSAPLSGGGLPTPQQSQLAP
jgi:hypothetical protein